MQLYEIKVVDPDDNIVVKVIVRSPSREAAVRTSRRAVGKHHPNVAAAIDILLCIGQLHLKVRELQDEASLAE